METKTKKKVKIIPRDFSINEDEKNITINASKKCYGDTWTKNQINYLEHLGCVIKRNDCSNSTYFKYVSKIEASYAIEKMKEGYTVEIIF